MSGTNCPNCGGVLKRDDGAYCEYCGAVVEEPEKPALEICNAEGEPVARFYNDRIVFKQVKAPSDTEVDH